MQREGRAMSTLSRFANGGGGAPADPPGGWPLPLSPLRTIRPTPSHAIPSHTPPPSPSSRRTGTTATFATMSDVNAHIIQPLKKFAKDSTHLVKKCTKPDRKGKPHHLPSHVLFLTPGSPRLYAHVLSKLPLFHLNLCLAQSLPG